MIRIKAKLLVESINETVSGKEVTFRAVSKDSEENKTFSMWTPSATLIMYINKGTLAYDYYKVGKEYYLTFDAAEEEQGVTD